MNLRHSLFIFVISFCSVVPLHGQIDKIENLKEDDSKRIRFGYYLGLNAIGAKMEYKPTYVSTPISHFCKTKAEF
jgi:hypothetical protein